mmetsp:Transcript_38643/g.96759  ORF Transcript_38643/g.96759 Transcript_38643/m.96759 type:complete len:279 (+) Transcript_38643:635-1471(+)
MNLVIALLLESEGALRQFAPLVGHEVTPLGEGNGVEVHHVGGLLHVPRIHCRQRSTDALTFVGLSGGLSGLLAQLGSLLPDVAPELLLLVASEVDPLELLEHLLALGRGSHLLVNRRFLVVGLRLPESRAVEELPPVLEDEFGKVEVLVLEDEDQLVLALLQVRGRQDRQYLLLCGDDDIGVGVELAQLALQPMRINLGDVEAVLVPLLDHILLVLIDARLQVPSFGLLPERLVVLIALLLLIDLIEVGVLGLLHGLILLVKHHGHSRRIVQLALGQR